jgi:hypothetical protein
MIKCSRGGGVDNKTKQISHGLKQCWTMVLEIVKDQSSWVSTWFGCLELKSYG